MDCRNNYTTLWLYQKILGCTLLKNDDDDDGGQWHECHDYFI